MKSQFEQMMDGLNDYDPENPGMTVAADPSRGRTRA